ncbi:hypothetical protein MNBD_GAMMA18-778, partial [hydrothermal vent metagenome]
MLLVTILCTIPAHADTAWGTHISNTASVNYEVKGITGFTTLSNTDTFVVMGPLNYAAMTISPFNNVYVGTPQTVDIDILNAGSNTLAEHRILITTPINTQVTLIGANATLLSTTDNGTTTTHYFSLDSLEPLLEQNLQATFTFTTDADIGDNQVTFVQQANGTEINRENVSFNLLERTEGTLEILQYSPSTNAELMLVNPTSYRSDNNVFLPIAAPDIPGQPGTPVTDGPIPLQITSKFNRQQTIFLRVTDLDQNLNRSTQEEILVSVNIHANGETEVVKLMETAPDSGIFSGYITLAAKAATPSDGALDINTNTEVLFSYTDDVDASDSRVSMVLIDPFGVVFDSATGQRLNGYRVEMIDIDTGLPAIVYGDDGTSRYPAAMTTGATVTDSSGRTYDHGEGNYRFPFAAAGNYKLVVTLPSGAQYAWPSNKSTELLYNLNISNLTITLGSRGEVFPLLPGPPLHIDIPLDPLTTPMYLQRSASKTSAAPGDFVHYKMSLENTTAVLLNDVVLTETLPQGFRLETGSVLINGAAVPSSAFSDNGNSITFNLGDVATATTYNIEYVASVGARSRGVGTSSSYATANNGAATSNTAEHDILMVDELMRYRALLMGQVIINFDDTSTGKQQQNNGLKGVRIYMENGRYAITDERGMYHFENVQPGTHVVQIDLDTIPSQYQVVATEENNRFAGSGISQFVDIQGGTLWRADFYVQKKPNPKGELLLQISNLATQEDNSIVYQINMQSQVVATQNLRLSIISPKGTQYTPGSSRIDGKTVADPEVRKQLLIYRLGDQKADWERSLQFTLAGIDRIESGVLLIKAIAAFNTPNKKNQRTPAATHSIELNVEQSTSHTIDELTIDELTIKPSFESGSATLNKKNEAMVDEFTEQFRHHNNIRIHAVGHSDNKLLRSAAKKTYTNNQRLSELRAHNVANQMNATLGLHKENVTVEGKGADMPLADNDSETGRAQNRRVEAVVYKKEIILTTKRKADYAVIGKKESVTTEGVQAAQAMPQTEEKQTLPRYDSVWLNQQNADTEWLLPEKTYIPHTPTTGVTIKHHADTTIQLSLNGEPVPAVNFNGSIKNNNSATLSSWAGVDLIVGDNTLKATLIDTLGRVVEEFTRNVHYASAPVRAELVKEKSVLIADGITSPVIALRFFDKDGYRVHRGVGIEFRLNRPFKMAQKDEFNTDNMPGAPSNRNYTQTEEEGIAFITLEPSNETDDIVIELPLSNGNELELRTHLKSKQRNWIIVGLAEGSTGFNRLSGNIQSLEGQSAEENLYQDGRIAFYAKGQIKGEWLLTMAYDSAKVRPHKSAGDPGMFQAIDPGSYYTVYGDTSRDGYGASSAEKLYLKLERDEFYFLFGDYETAFNDTELAQYNRALTGIKSRYRDDTYDLILFGSETNQAFIKDEFRGKGSTGPYTLSRNRVALNAETVTIETRDRFRGEDIVNTQQLTRHKDYDIDYAAGVITLREPLFSTNQNLNHVYLVVKYESYDEFDDKVSIGGRAKVNATDKLAVGITHIEEGRTGGEVKLSGIDISYKLNTQTKINLEAAHSIDSIDTAGTANGSAYQVEVEHNTKNSSSTLYLNNRDNGFGIGQTNSSENGMRKAGLETKIKAMDNLNITAQLYRQEQTETNTTRDLVEAKVETTANKMRLKAGLRNVTDNRGNGDKQTSEQITAGISRDFLNDRLKLRADREQNLNSSNSVDYPTRTRLGADYQLNSNASLFVEQEITDGEVRDTRSTLMGIKSTPWSGGKIYTGVKKSSSLNGETSSANVAVQQKFQINEKWSLDVGAEESRTLSNAAVTPLNPNTPFSSGNTNDFTATSVGATYRSPSSWMATTRVESRNSQTENGWRIASSLQTTPKSRLSLLTAFKLSETSKMTGEKQNNRSIQLGLAYRPQQSKWL